MHINLKLIDHDIRKDWYVRGSYLVIRKSKPVAFCSNSFTKQIMKPSTESKSANVSSYRAMSTRKIFMPRDKEVMMKGFPERSMREYPAAKWSELETI